MAVLSKPSRLVDLNRNRQILTRYQERRIRQTFQFLELPPELRNMIYELAIDLSGIEEYFNRFYAKLRHAKSGSRITPPRFNYKTPAILLVNRQIFTEAVSLFSKKGVTFHHGLMGLSGVHEVVSEQVLQKLSSITITTNGHHILRKNIVTISWRGYMDLITHLSTILAGGHKLKHLTINFDDPSLKLHMTACWDADNHCDFRDNIREAFNNLRSIRGVGFVTLTGIPSSLALELKARMESKPKSFLDLPGEIRNQVYESCGDWSDISIQLARTMEVWTDRRQPPTYPKASTPTVLLLNRQVRDEALSVLCSKPLVITFPGDHSLQKQADILLITKLISEGTLLKVKDLTIRIEAWEWMYSLQDLIPVFFNENHSLETLHIYFRDSLKHQFLAFPQKKYPDSTLHSYLSNISDIRGVRKVTFDGDLPSVYTDCLVEMMQRPNHDPNQPLLPFKAVQGDGTIVAPDEIGD